MKRETVTKIGIAYLSSSPVICLNIIEATALRNAPFRCMRTVVLD